MNIINIYTDGSSLIKKDKYKSSSACIIESDNVYYELGMFHKGGTISYGELTAIRLGIDLVSEYIDDDTEVNLFSDSEYCVKSLTEWIHNWSKSGRNTEWIKSDGKHVMYQDVMKHIYYNYLTIYKNIHIYHINSHLNNKAQYKKSLAKFLKKNKNFTEDDFKRIVSYNDRVDKIALKILNDECLYYTYGYSKINKCNLILNTNIFKKEV